MADLVYSHLLHVCYFRSVTYQQVSDFSPVNAISRIHDLKIRFVTVVIIAAENGKSITLAHTKLEILRNLQRKKTRSESRHLG